MKKINTLCKILLIVLILLNISLIICNYVSALSISLPSMDPFPSGGGGNSRINEIGARVLWVLQVLFYAAAVIIIMYKGVKYMASAPEAKAEFKKKMIYMVFGAIMLFAAGGITQIIANFTLSNI